jgi:serine/threonine protein kinase
MLDSEVLLILSRLELEKPELIKDGTFGEVYKAFKINTDTIQCIKIITLDKFEMEEYKTSCKLKKEKNENLLLCEEMYGKSKYVGLVMDFVSGGDLKKYVDDHSEKFTENEIIDIVYQILSGISTIHNLNIAHRFKIC